MRLKSFAEARLYAFVDLAYLGGRDPIVIAQHLCDGGADVIQLRAKMATVDEVRRLAEVLLPITESNGVMLVVNDHPQIAFAVGAPACHLGQEDFFVAGRRQVAEVVGSPPGLQLGLSTHAPDQALRALGAGPDYLAIGPVYSTPTKPGRTATGLEYVRWAAQHVSLPWFAIGGITLSNVDDVLGAGATRICVVSAILNAASVSVACQKFKERLTYA